MRQHSISNSLLNVALVLAESAITIVLRVDPKLRQAMYPLAKKNTIVSIRSYLPHVQFYATFTARGILLDSTISKENAEADVVINAFSHQLISSLFSNDVKQVHKLTMRGNTETVTQLRQFLTQLGFASLFKGVIETVKGNKNSKGKEPNVEQRKEADYKAKVQEQQLQITTLSVRNRELEVSIKQEQSKLKTTLIALVVASIVAVVSVIGWMFT